MSHTKRNRESFFAHLVTIAQVFHVFVMSIKEFLSQAHSTYFEDNREVEYKKSIVVTHKNTNILSNKHHYQTSFNILNDVCIIIFTIIDKCKLAKEKRRKKQTNYNL